LTETILDRLTRVAHILSEHYSVPDNIIEALFQELAQCLHDKIIEEMNNIQAEEENQKYVQ